MLILIFDICTVRKWPVLLTFQSNALPPSSEVFFCPRANAELVLKSHVALHASHAALPILT